MNTHTPGPWEAIITKHTDVDGNDLTHAEIVPVGTRGWMGERYMCVSGCVEPADAHLLAAAPDLYEALWAMVTSFHAVEYMEPHMQQAANKARAAIAKAQGENNANR